MNYGQQGHHFCGGRGQIAAAFGKKISLENLEQQMVATTEQAVADVFGDSKRRSHKNLRLETLNL